MTDDELLIISPLDQDVEIQDEDHVQEKIKQMILDSIAEKNAQKAINICFQLVKIIKLGGRALADSLYLIAIHWKELGVHDAFEDVIASTTGLNKAVVQRYVMVSRMHAENWIPEQFREEISKKNIRDQIPIAQALNMGYEIEDDDWEELVDTTDFTTLNAKMRGVKGKEPRTNALMLMMDREGGIKALHYGKQHHVGWLNVDDDNEVVQQAIRRIIKAGGILEQ